MRSLRRGDTLRSQLEVGPERALRGALCGCRLSGGARRGPPSSWSSASRLLRCLRAFPCGSAAVPSISHLPSFLRWLCFNKAPCSDPQGWRRARVLASRRQHLACNMMMCTAGDARACISPVLQLPCTGADRMVQGAPELVPDALTKFRRRQP